ncbi:MAG: response regulator [Euryhalocaulis sp.]|uniref:ATP-binding protein n=1 Tax=Euryhalocaulis sp. TaxID=2744307 RepID=UPI001792739B|nr:ATP-binding protein [Euryhalocaulis sp.]MBA4800610.1 response regulator [Euryhalocaulis sp.]
MVLKRTLVEADRAAKQWSISTTLQSQHLRYVYITAWALPVAAAAGWLPALVWFVFTILFGLFRGHVEKGIGRRKDGRNTQGVFGEWYTAIAAATSAVWAISPIMVWLSGHPAGKPAALALVAAGFFLVITQFRGSPKRAIWVSSPYALTAVVLGLLTFRGMEMVLYFAALAALALTIGHTIFHLHLSHRRIIESQLEQDRLIGELRKARDAAESANRAKSSFLAMVSHEIRTPLNGVLGGAQLLEASELDDSQHKLVKMLKSSGSSLLGILNDVLDLSKIEAEGMTLESIEIDLPELLAGACEMWRPMAEEKALTLTLEAGELPTRIVGDPTRINQVLNNLLSNAIKFTESGGVVIRAGAEALDGGKAKVSLAISDSGPGITTDVQQRLFQPFTQADDSITRRFGGTGLGLTICRRLARLMNGEIDVESTPGEGATFTLSIVSAVVEWNGETRAAGACATAVTDSDASLSVLVAEDNPVNQQVIEAFLKGANHTLSIAQNGEKAVEAASVERFDVILMDVHMPVMDGLQAAREIRNGGGSNAATPIVMLSASAMPEEQRAGMEAGANAYLTKPIEPEKLFATLGKVTNGASPLAKAG